MPVVTKTPTSLAFILDREHNTAQHRMKMAYAYCIIILAYDRCVLDIHWKKRNDSNHETLISSLGPRQCLSLSIIASAMLGPNCILVIKISVIISPTRQRPRTRHPTPRQNQPPTQFVPHHVYSPFASDFSMQESSSLRFQPTFAGSFLGAALPVKSNGCRRSGSEFSYKKRRGSYRTTTMATTKKRISLDTDWSGTNGDWYPH
jgi:hypothetical protein